MGIENEYRIARSAGSDTTFNTLDLKRAPSFALLEFLDPNDSQYFAGVLKGKGWRDVTPEPHKSRKTLENTAAKAGELEAFLDITPDWMYLSGHYGRTYYMAQGKTLTVLPAGFFNEPYHVAEWDSAWTKKSAQGVFMQGESFDDAGLKVFQDYIKAQQLIHDGTGFHSADKRPASDRAGEWGPVWQKPIEDASVSSFPVPGSRGMLFKNTWDDVKVLLLVCCNALVWNKKGFRDAFPNALVIGWVAKNPANAVPIVKQFLINAFRGVKDPADPILMNHDHIAAAWTEVFFKQGLFGASGLGYMKPDGTVFAVTRTSTTETFIGTANQVTGTWVQKDHVFAFGVNNDPKATEP